MCDLTTSPSSFGAMAISTACRTEFTQVSPCIADGRNHTDCCVRKGVQHECLKICNGSPEPLGLHSLLCLNLDLNAIYECVREGYGKLLFIIKYVLLNSGTHPSPPVNVTVTDVTAVSAQLQWAEPSSNSDKVISYSVFVRKDEYGQSYYEVRYMTTI
jgi:hypothetical protein